MIHLMLIVVQSICLGAMITAWVHERPYNWFSWLIIVGLVWGIGYQTYYVLEPHCRNVTILVFPDPPKYIS
jgi:hypothetical protein